MGSENTVEYAIDVKNLTKKFKVYFDKGNQLKEKMLFWKRNKYEERWVLNGVSFQIKKGEAIGLIGHNGCGKSTTLKLLSRIIYPDSGTITMNGRVSSLIELGAGFHPDMSGRENIFTNASIFGLSRKEIEERYDDIVAFSELEEFIDNPVRTYSSGMYMRLAFSVAINVNADILLVDEILAVGDSNFQAKCFNKMREIKAQGTTIVIVSHSLAQIEQICDRTIWIHDGKIAGEGAPRDVHPEYLEFMGRQRMEAAKAAKELEEKEQIEAEHAHIEAEKQRMEEEKQREEEEKKKNRKRWGDRRAVITDVKLKSENGNVQNVFFTGDNMVITMKYRVDTPVKDAVFGFGIFRSDGLWCYGTNTRLDKFDIFDLNEDGEITIALNGVNLIAGAYILDITIESDDGIPVDYYRDAVRFEVQSPISDVGVFRIPHEWDLSRSK